MRIQFQIFLGIFLTVLTIGVFLYSGFTEEARMQEWTSEQLALSIERGADLYSQACDGCHGPQGLGIPNLCPPLNDKNFFTNRMREVGWSGSLRDYIISTISSGRLTSTRPEYVGNGRPAMPSWGEDFGGPLRGDEIENLADFILNWEEEALARPDVTPSPIDGVGTDITVELPEGDVTRGEALAVAQGCTGCHVSQAVGPAWAASASQPGIGDRAETRWQEGSTYTGSATSAQQYLLEAIVLPNVHLVEGFAANLMPQTYGDTLTDQQASDLIAYMLTIR
jgi:mono/diheme cytochrome c family protein